MPVSIQKMLYKATVGSNNASCFILHLTQMSPFFVKVKPPSLCSVLHLHVCTFLSLFPSFSLPLIPLSFLFLPCLPSSHSHFLLYPPVFYYQAPVISLDIKKYTSTEQLWAIKKNRFSPGPCECCTVDA